MQKLLNSYMTKYLCNCDTVTLCDTALWDIFDGHLKDGQRHGMDTFLFLNAFILWNNEAVFTIDTYDMRYSTSYADPVSGTP
jgi:hypothetical protein